MHIYFFFLVGEGGGGAEDSYNSYHKCDSEVCALAWHRITSSLSLLIMVLCKPLSPSLEAFSSGMSG